MHVQKKLRLSFIKRERELGENKWRRIIIIKKNMSKLNLFI